MGALAEVTLPRRPLWWGATPTRTCRLYGVMTAMSAARTPASTSAWTCRLTRRTSPGGGWTALQHEGRTSRTPVTRAGFLSTFPAVTTGGSHTRLAVACWEGTPDPTLEAQGPPRTGLPLSGQEQLCPLPTWLPRGRPLTAGPPLP